MRLPVCAAKNVPVSVIEEPKICALPESKLYFGSIREKALN